MRILVASREDVDLDEVAADGLRERLQVRQRGDDADLAGGVAALGHGAEDHETGDQDDGKTSHGTTPQKGCAGCAPRMKVAWRNSSLSVSGPAPKSDRSVYL